MLIAGWFILPTLNEVGSFVTMIGGLMSIGAGVVGVMGLNTKLRGYWASRSVSRTTLSQNEDALAIPLNQFVPRRDVEEDVLRHSFKKSTEYSVVVGPRGCGKSIAVAHALLDKPGVIDLSVDSSTGNFFDLLVLKLKVPSWQNRFADSETRVRYFLGCVRRHRYVSFWNRTPVRLLFGQKGPIVNESWVPTLLVEVDSIAGSDTVKDYVTKLKKLNSDRRLCHVVMVLSDANAAFSLPGSDGDRQHLIWVDDFTLDEANQFFDVRNFLTGPENQANRSFLFEMVGTRPIRLERAVNRLKEDPSKEKIDQFVDIVVGDARRTLRGLLSLERTHGQFGQPGGKDFQLLIDALFNLGDDWRNGVPVSEFSGTLLGDAEAVAQALKEEHALLYHFPTDTYRFCDVTFYHAAKSLNLDKVTAVTTGK